MTEGINIWQPKGLLKNFFELQGIFKITQKCGYNNFLFFFFFFFFIFFPE